MGGYGETIVGAIIYAVIAAAVSYAANELFGPEPPKAKNRLANNPHLASTSSNDFLMKLLYGECRVGGNEVFRGVSGNDNQYLHIVWVAGEGPVEGVKEVDGVKQIFLDDQLYTDFGDLVHVEEFTGTADQTVNATLQAAFPEFQEPMRYSAGLYVRFKWDRDRLNTKPNITAVYQGLKLFDPHAGGDAVYSNKPALAGYDMLTRPSTRGGLGLDVWHGPVPGSPKITTSFVDDAADYCTTKGWTCNMPVYEDAAFSDNFSLVMACMRGAVVNSAGTYKMLFRDLNYESVVMSFTDDHIAMDERGVSTLEIESGSVFDLPNAIRVVYYNEEGSSSGKFKYQLDDFVDTIDDGLSSDGDYREKEIQLYGLTSLDKVKAMANYYKERWRNAYLVRFQTGDRAMVLEPMDLIQVTSTYTGWTQKKLRVLQPPYEAESRMVQMVCIFEDVDFYDDVYNPGFIDFYETSLLSPNAAVPSVINTSVTERVYYYRGRSFTRLEIEFDPPPVTSYPYWDHAEVYVKVGESGAYVHRTNSSTDYEIDPVQEGETYYIKLRSVNVFGAKEDFDSAALLSRTVIGKTESPSDLSSITAAANGDTVSIFADPVADPDIEGYEIRVGDAWVGGLFIAFEKYPSVRLIGVRPGTHTFWMSPKDNNGNYSDNPVSSTVTVFVPPGYTELATYGSWTWDYDGVGTHDNTEHTTRNFNGVIEDTLMCSHEAVDSGPTLDTVQLWTGSEYDDLQIYDSGESQNEDLQLATPQSAADLDGVYTTPAYDLGSLVRVRVWGDFITEFISNDTTFDGAMPYPTTFNDLDTQLGVGWTFNELFSPSAASNIQATLYYSEDGSNYNQIERCEIRCAEIYARYVYMKVKIVDPTDGSRLYLKELDMKAYTGPQAG